MRRLPIISWHYFPLTPALSLGERENYIPPVEIPSNRFAGSESKILQPGSLNSFVHTLVEKQRTAVLANSLLKK
jgi:hypothetical protein